MIFLLKREGVLFKHFPCLKNNFNEGYDLVSQNSMEDRDKEEFSTILKRIMDNNTESELEKY